MDVASTVWRGRIAFGMVAIPVRLFKAARRERVRFRQVYAPPPEPEPEIEEPPAAPRSSVLRQFPAPPAGRIPVPQEPPPDLEKDESELPAAVSRVRENIVGAGDAKPVPRESILKGFEAARDEYVVFKPAEI